ncbi:MAG: hypothetical protein KAS07_03935 [Candidatus Pacebacteria bacterium]|nr:hypothetical protein [Candidatus Paceibacterota bacterium]
MPKKIINKSNIILALFVTVILVGVVMIVLSSRTIPVVPAEPERTPPTGAEPGGLVLSQQECVSQGGRVADTTQGDTCVGDEEAISAVTGFYAPGLCCVSNYEKKLTQEEALAIAQRAEVCIEGGSVADFETYNPNSKTWWFSITSIRSDCRPACVVSDETGDADINWRCMGLIEPTEPTEPIEQEEDVEKIPRGDVAERCEVFGGKWLQLPSECENISQEVCDTLGGVFNECGSACRHDPDAETCIMMCVPYCAI